MERTKKAWINAILFAVTLAVNTMGRWVSSTACRKRKSPTDTSP